MGAAVFGANISDLLIGWAHSKSETIGWYNQVTSVIALGLLTVSSA